MTANRNIFASTNANKHTGQSYSVLMKGLFSVPESLKLFIILIFWTLMVLWEVFFGILKINIHLIADGFQSFLHILSFSFSLYALTFSKQLPNKRMSYGYSRYETLSAFSNCIFLLFICLFNVFRHFHHVIEEFEDKNIQVFSDQGLQNVLNSDDLTPHEAGEKNLCFFYLLRLILCICTLIAFFEYGKLFQENEAANKMHQAYMGLIHKPKVMKIAEIFVYPQTEESNPITHPVNYYKNIGMSSHWENLHSVFLHAWIEAMIDLLSIIGFIFEDVPKFYILEILLAIATGIISIKLTKPLILSTALVLLQGCPCLSNQDLDKIKRDISFVEGVANIEELRFWGLNTNYLVAQIKILLIDSSHYFQALTEIKEILAPKFNEYNIDLEW